MPVKPVWTILNSDCRIALAHMSPESIDAVVCDPPYEINFMGRGWDNAGIAFDSKMWASVMRVLKPGGHMLVMGGTRTYHRMACAVEDAGFEIRDSILSLHSLGDSTSKEVLQTWMNWSERANHAGIRFVKNQIEVGSNIVSNDFVLGLALLGTNLVNSHADAIIAELHSREARLTAVEHWRSVLVNADGFIMESNALVSIAGNLLESPDAMCMDISTVQENALGWLVASTEAITRAVEALKIWLGSPPSLKQAATNVLCVALTDALKHIICAQSEIFRGYDMISRMASVCAMNVITTEFTAALLILYMGDMLENEGGDAKEASGGLLAWMYGSGFP